MYYSLEEEGVLQVVLERFQKQRFPRLMDIKDKVDQGGVLNDFDVEFLDEVLTDTQKYKHFVDEHPEFQEFYARVAHLYEELTQTALDNEKQSGA